MTSLLNKLGLNKPDKRKKTLLLVGALVIFILVFYRFFPLLENIESLEEEILLKERNLIKYRQIVKERNELEARQIALNHSLEKAETRLLDGKTASLGAVDIQNTLKEITDKRDMEVLTMRVLRPESNEEDIYMAIPVQITVRCTIRQLKEIIYRIESSPKLLKISDCRIRVIRGRVEGQIQATLTVRGFMKKNE